MGKDGEKRPFWFFRIIILLGFILAGFIIFASSKETYRKRQVEQEISNLKKEAERIEKNNIELSGKIAYFESRDYQEKEAKDKLNLQDPKENLIIVKPGLSAEQQKKEEAPSSGQKLTIRESNVQKWWDYFFKQ